VTDVSHHDVQLQFDAVMTDVAAAERASGRLAGSVQVIAVSKTHPVERIRPLAAAGHRLFGENRVKEAETKWPALRGSRIFAGIYPDPAVRAHWTYKFDQFYDKTLISWDGRWAFACVVNRGLAIIPRVNLITNIGYGPDAAHTTNPNDEKALLPVEPIGFPLVHPSVVSPDPVADAFTFKNHYGINRGLKRRALNWTRFNLPRTYWLLKSISSLSRSS